MPEQAYVGFGSNLGDRAAFLETAIRRLSDRGCSVLRISSLYETEPWGGAEGEAFLNAVLEVARTDSAPAFLSNLLEIERDLGRSREKPLSARTCDLDLLLWGGEVIRKPELTVPHPRLHMRRFVLVPLCDLIPDAVHPVLKLTFSELLAECPDPLQVWPFQPTHLPPCP